MSTCGATFRAPWARARSESRPAWAKAARPLVPSLHRLDRDTEDTAPTDEEIARRAYETYQRRVRARTGPADPRSGAVPESRGGRDDPR
jgi:hypothetical protein